MKRILLIVPLLTIVYSTHCDELTDLEQKRDNLIEEKNKAEAEMEKANVCARTLQNHIAHYKALTYKIIHTLDRIKALKKGEKPISGQ